MLIEIHMIQNHSPANLNRDDLGAPKTCYFGGVLRSRISSQCLKRSIRLSPQFAELLGGIRTRRLAGKIAEEAGGTDEARQKAEAVMKLIGFMPKKQGKKTDEDEEEQQSEESKAVIFVSRKILSEMAALVRDMRKGQEQVVARKFAELIATHVSVPDMALSGRMLEPDKSSKTIWAEVDEPNVEASLQVAHAISTHEARSEVDYFTTADDVKGRDAGAALVGEAMFASACFYKYFSIHWEELIKNLKGQEELAAHTVGAFLRGAALTTPTGKQNSFAAQNPPDGVLIEFKHSPISYANAFAKPVAVGERDLVEQSIAQLAHYAHDLDVGYGGPQARFWFSPNGRHPFNVMEGQAKKPLTEHQFKSLDELVRATIKQLGHDWDAVQQVKP